MAEYGGVKASMQVEDPEDVRVSLTLTMRVRDWRVLNGELLKMGGYPQWAIRAGIADLIESVTQKYTAMEREE